ncbi:hypothetical protein ACFPRL_21995 [Pseudoclavibacter helvolus]
MLVRRVRRIRSAHCCLTTSRRCRRGPCASSAYRRASSRRAPARS